MRISLVLLALALAACGSDPDGFDDSQVPGHLRQPILEAIATVNADTGSRFRLEPGGDSSIVFEAMTDACGRGGRERIMRRLRVIFHTDYLIEPRASDSRCQLFPPAARHEFGHAAGLGHVCDNTSYMHSPDACR